MDMGYTYKARKNVTISKSNKPMKKIFSLCILTFVFFSLAAVGHAQNDKVITLTDGSVLKGKVVELKDNMYTIEILPGWEAESGESVEPLKIPASSVESITPDTPKKELSPAENANIKDQAVKLQNKIMEDTDIMGQMNQLAGQEEIKQLLSDPGVLSDVMSMDPDKIQNNENVQKLLNNPEMQKLLLHIQQKFPAQ
jgi:hypothetical protein